MKPPMWGLRGSSGWLHNPAMSWRQRVAWRGSFGEGTQLVFGTRRPGAWHFIKKRTSQASELLWGNPLPRRKRMYQHHSSSAKHRGSFIQRWLPFPFYAGGNRTLGGEKKTIFLEIGRGSREQPRNFLWHFSFPDSYKQIAFLPRFDYDFHAVLLCFMYSTDILMINNYISTLFRGA